MTHIGERIKELRIEKNMTLKELGEEINFNYSNLSKIERGLRKPTLEFLESISTYYKIDISYFFRSNTKVPNHLPIKDCEWMALSEKIKEKNLTWEELRDLTNTFIKFKYSPSKQ